MLTRSLDALRACCGGWARVAAAFALSALCAAAGSAQTSEPRRPRLERGVDTRDWRSYLDCALTTRDRGRATACLDWARRLDPSRPEPRYARWLASALKDTAEQHAALLLDPFFYHARVLAVEAPARNPFMSPETRAWGALRSGDYFGATRAFEEHLARHPDDVDGRWGIAVALYYRERYDSSAAHLRLLEDALRRRESEQLSSVYRSLEFVAYMQAVAHLAGGRPDSARAALERALTESFAFYHARMLLADMAASGADWAAAEREWAQARDLYGGDVVARRRYGRFLLEAGRAEAAERELRAVLAAEPEWVDARLDLARAIDQQGEARRADAVREYADYIARAPAEPAAPRLRAEARLAALEGN